MLVAEINPAYADGEALSQAYDLPKEMAVNCLIVKGVRGDVEKYAALFIPCGMRANMNATLRRPLDVKKVGFADLAYVCQMTGMAYGTMAPLGLPESWRVLIDASLLSQENVIIGGGLAKSKILLPTVLLKSLPQAMIIAGLAKR